MIDKKVGPGPAGLLDTSVLIAAETGHPLDEASIPETVSVSVVTLAELRAGVLAASDSGTRARRLATLDSIADLDALPIDGQAAAVWAELRARLAEVGRRCNVNDLWIASVAVANDLPVVTQDLDYDVLEDIGGPAVIRV